MLKNIPKVLSPDLLKYLCEMGHGDELVIADGNFPAAGMAKHLVRADGIDAPTMLDAVLKVIPLDQYDNNHFVLMEVCEGDSVVPVIWEKYTAILHQHEPNSSADKMERFAYYERAKNAYVIIATGEEAQYANIILKKGCILPGENSN
jgi:L-fucose mutarotase